VIFFFVRVRGLRQLVSSAILSWNCMPGNVMPGKACRFLCCEYFCGDDRHIEKIYLIGSMSRDIFKWISSLRICIVTWR